MRTFTSLMNCARGESKNSFTSNIKHFLIKKAGRPLTGNTINNFHRELYLRFLHLVIQILITRTSKKINGSLFIFNQVTYLLNIFLEDIFGSHFISKPPVKWNSNVKINRFSNEYSISCKSSNNKWYISIL